MRICYSYSVTVLLTECTCTKMERMKRRDEKTMKGNGRGIGKRMGLCVVTNQGFHADFQRSCDREKITRPLGLRLYSLQGDSPQPR